MNNPIHRQQWRLEKAKIEARDAQDAAFGQFCTDRNGWCSAGWWQCENGAFFLVECGDDGKWQVSKPSFAETQPESGWLWVPVVPEDEAVYRSWPVIRVEVGHDAMVFVDSYTLHVQLQALPTKGAILGNDGLWAAATWQQAFNPANQFFVFFGGRWEFASQQMIQDLQIRATMPSHQSPTPPLIAGTVSGTPDQSLAPGLPLSGNTRKALPPLLDGQLLGDFAGPADQQGQSSAAAQPQQSSGNLLSAEEIDQFMIALLSFEDFEGSPVGEQN